MSIHHKVTFTLPSKSQKVNKIALDTWNRAVADFKEGRLPILRDAIFLRVLGLNEPYFEAW